TDSLETGIRFNGGCYSVKKKSKTGNPLKSLQSAPCILQKRITLTKRKRGGCS
uniref:Uncharacterized protein n=1 Tax=Anopheles atroparvus TaxID=41427 RepID=A0AAG5CSQ8_ANOAO